MTDIFDDLVATDTKATDETETAEPTAEATETNAPEWPKTLTLAPGEAPEGAVSVADFAKLVNEQVVGERVAELLSEGKSPVEAAMEAMASQVNQASFYQAVKAQRNPLPHYIVQYEVPVLDAEGNETGDVKTEEKTFVPVEVGQDWWQNRPTRGGGGASRTAEDITKRLYRAGKKAVNLKTAEARLTKLTENVKSMREQLEKYSEWLREDGKTIDDAIAAYEEQAEKEEAEKAISDDE